MYCEPLTSNSKNKQLIQNFYIDREKEYSNPKTTGTICGLESYLKYSAWDDDAAHEVKIYVVKTYIKSEIVAYFGLKAGMISDFSSPIDGKIQATAIKNHVKAVPSTISGIELSHFAIDDHYKIKHGSHAQDGSIIPLKGLGQVIYPMFIFPIIKKAASLIGVKTLYLYAVDKYNLAEYYHKAFQFERIDINKDMYIPIQSYYDNDCEFMFLNL